MDLVFALKWSKSFIGSTLYISLTQNNHQILLETESNNSIDLK